MKKIINLNNPNIKEPKENNPTELLDVFILERIHPAAYAKA